jgi:phosphatidylglycerol:prolipoprotein diacylglycerol transferase
MAGIFTYPMQIFAIWQGGISIEGAIAGGVITLLVYSRAHKISFFEFADYLSPALILAQGIGRIACFMNGDVFGKPTGGNFGIVYPKNSYASPYYDSQPLWPAEVWESQGNMVLFSILYMIHVLGGYRLAESDTASVAKATVTTKSISKHFKALLLYLLHTKYVHKF